MLVAKAKQLIEALKNQKEMLDLLKQLGNSEGKEEGTEGDKQEQRTEIL